MGAGAERGSLSDGQSRDEVIDVGLQRDRALGLEVERRFHVVHLEFEAGNPLLELPRFRDFVGVGAKEGSDCRLAFRRHRRKS